MEIDPNSVNNVVLFPVIETNYSNPLITVCSETSTQQELLPTSVKNLVIFTVIKTDSTSVNNVLLFSVMETDQSEPLTTV